MDIQKEQAWESVRRKGRGRFLLRSIGRAAWICGIAAFVIHVSIVVISKGNAMPLWEVAATWAFL